MVYIFTNHKTRFFSSLIPISLPRPARPPSADCIFMHRSKAEIDCISVHNLPRPSRPEPLPEHVEPLLADPHELATVLYTALYGLEEVIQELVVYRDAPALGH